MFELSLLRLCNDERFALDSIYCCWLFLLHLQFACPNLLLLLDRVVYEALSSHDEGKQLVHVLDLEIDSPLLQSQRNAFPRKERLIFFIFFLEKAANFVFVITECHAKWTVEDSEDVVQHAFAMFATMDVSPLELRSLRIYTHDACSTFAGCIVVLEGPNASLELIDACYVEQRRFFEKDETFFLDLRLCFHIV